MGDFFGLHVGLSALYAQRRAIDITGHNVANANTDGYSRQRVGLVADAGPATPALFSRWNEGGEGVTVAGIDRLRDEFLEVRAYQEHAAESELGRMQETLSRIELAFAEPGDDGLAAQLADFWAAWDDLANRPTDVASRAQLVERARTLAVGFEQAITSLNSLRSSLNEQVDASVVEVNALAGRVAELNSRIQNAELSGLSGNDLMDQRDQLIARLATMAGVTVRPADAGMVDVYIAGTALVRGTRAELLAAQIDPGGGRSIVWAKDGLPAQVGGDSRALLDAVNDVIPRYTAELMTIATQVHDDVNALHTTGYAMDGATTGLTFFQLTPTGIAVNPAITADPRLIAAAAAPGAPNDGALAQQMAEMTGADISYRELVVRLGVEAQTVNRRVEVQAAITAQIDSAREAVSGVNIDEEMVNMVSFQRAYEAAARFITAVDEMLDTLVNGTGIVGR